MVDDREAPRDWQDLWDEPRHGDWDLDELEMSTDPDDWEEFTGDMGDGYREWLDSGGRPGSIPLSLLRPINDWLRDHDIEPRTWWSELYGR